MGGQQSKSTVNSLSDIISEVFLDVSQDCTKLIYQTNSITIAGSGNSVNNITQKTSVNVSMDCILNMTQKTDFEQKLVDQIMQNLQQKTTGLISWTDAQNQQTITNITNKIKSTINTKVFLNCMATVNSNNIITVTGNSNDLNNLTQLATISLVSNCLMSNTQIAHTLTDIAATIDQTSGQVSTNPIEPIVTTIQGFFNSATLLLYAPFLFILAILYILLN